MADPNDVPEEIPRMPLAGETWKHIRTGNDYLVKDISIQLKTTENSEWRTAILYTNGMQIFCRPLGMFLLNFDFVKS